MFIGAHLRDFFWCLSNTCYDMFIDTCQTQVRICLLVLA